MIFFFAIFPSLLYFAVLWFLFFVSAGFFTLEILGVSINFSDVRRRANVGAGLGKRIQGWSRLRRGSQAIEASSYLDRRVSAQPGNRRHICAVHYPSAQQRGLPSLHQADAAGLLVAIVYSI